MDPFYYETFKIEPSVSRTRPSSLPMDAFSDRGGIPPHVALSPANNNLENVYIRNDVVNPDCWVLHKTDHFHLCNNKSLFTRLDMLKDPIDIQNEQGFIGVQALGVGQISVPIWAENGAPSRLSLHEVYFAPRSSVSSISFTRCTKTDGFYSWTEMMTGLRMNRAGLPAVFFDTSSARFMTMRLAGDIAGDMFFGINPPVHSRCDPFASRFALGRQPDVEVVDGIHKAMSSIRRLMEMKRIGQDATKEGKRLDKQSIIGITVGDIVRMLDWELPHRMYPQEQVFLPHPDRLAWASDLSVKTSTRGSTKDDEETVVASEDSLATNRTDTTAS
ncbi:hypothetical protein IWX49DRAFT_586714 [Phyllosticta citricarpa]|uniref:Uncharacterized protein n=2 Tax=Phyllosticta TaxID=121621 RepID=A0ABR1MQQ1_9PEZI